MNITDVCLGLFFLYFVLMSGSCSEVMNCGLQRYIQNNNWIKHFMIFFSIYVFTFILNWYTYDALFVGYKGAVRTDKIIGKETYLKTSLYYLFNIYLINKK